MKEFKTVLHEDQVTIFYEGAGSEITIHSLVDEDSSEEIELEFASPESVEIYAALQTHDYEQRAETNEHDSDFYYNR